MYGGLTLRVPHLGFAASNPLLGFSSHSHLIPQSGLHFFALRKNGGERGIGLRPSALSLCDALRAPHLQSPALRAPSVKPPVPSGSHPALTLCRKAACIFLRCEKMAEREGFEHFISSSLILTVFHLYLLINALQIYA